MLKAALARLTLYVPPVHDEYMRRSFGGSPNDSFLVVTHIMEARNLVLRRSLNNVKDVFGSDVNDQQQLLWRWQELSPRLVEFLNGEPAPGTVFREKQYVPFRPRGPQQFRNTPLPLEGMVKNGTTIVDIGFVDFGIVFDCLSSVSPQGQPITIDGVDAEPFCVAKAMVMYAMAKDPSNNPRSIVEVWLSSLWSAATSKAFSGAVKKVLRETAVDLDRKVMKILLFWKNHPRISRAKAERFQIGMALEGTDIRFCTRACGLAKERDRTDYVRYHFTKAIYEDESTNIGSPVLCTVDESIGIAQICENAFEAVPFHVFSWLDADIEEDRSLMERVQYYFESQIRQYMTLVQADVIQFVPKLGTLAPENVALLQELAELKPFLVSWSNVIDYMPPDHFHSMARTISCEDTMHYFHSINWGTRTYGVDIYDIYQDSRMNIFSAGVAFWEQSRVMLSSNFEPQGPFHFRNVCSPVLARQFINAFLRYFFEGQDVNCGGFFDGGSPLGLPNPLGRNDATAFLAFAYKESGICFPRNSYDFTTDT